ncbi:hypothetical protein QYM42_07015 [Lactococcus lactis]|uniref:hypothetical protein n=1 Tax=Lactococcus lactis TaxID=1358 RepID=UPI00265A57DC|nr:hypothetical protein [Lactococcus lactis]WKF72134.1 hypothetical protein QYM42_07015 [Lactococcus lactis]
MIPPNKLNRKYFFKEYKSEPAIKTENSGINNLTSIKLFPPALINSGERLERKLKPNQRNAMIGI